MSDSEAKDTTELSGSAPHDTRSTKFLDELRLAIGFLTILPVLGERRASDESVAASFGWFPLVGLLIGAALCAEDWILAHVFAQVIRSVFIVFSMAAITGAVHLDGLADTADALGAGRNRTRALEILRDSRIGTFGAIAVFFDLTLKILALSTLTGSRRYAALLLAPALARWSMVAVAAEMTYLRSKGAGSVLLAGIGTRVLLRASFTVLAAIILMLSSRTFGAAITGVATVVVMRVLYRRWLGGITGDLIGACGELVEVAALLALS
jgi:adenosylcobinamide-GDP ribazoletransferase